MAMTSNLKVDIDLAQLRKVGLSDRMFSLLLGMLLNRDEKFRTEQLVEARLIVETILGHRLSGPDETTTKEGNDVDR